MPDPTHWLRKVPDESLRHAIESHAATTASIMVALDVPPQRIERVPGTERVSDQSAARHSKPQLWVAPIPAAEMGHVEAKADQLKGLITSTVGREPVYLKGSRAFVVEASPDQIRTLAESDLVRQIRVNRHLG